MTKTTIALWLALGVTAPIQAQDGVAFRDKVLIEARAGTVTRDNGFTPVVSQVRLGYKVSPLLGAFAHFEAGFGLDKGSKGIGSYMATNSLGGGLTCKLLKWEDLTLDVHGLLGTTTGNYAWKHTLYEGGLTMGFSGRMSPTVGIGFRAMDSRAAGIKTHLGLVFTLGFRM